MSIKWKTYEPSKLSEMVRSRRPVFVLNTSLFDSGTRGTIIINFIDGSRKRHFEVPDTFIPLCITDSIPEDILLSSPDFKDLLRKRIISLVDSDQAEEFLKSDEAKEEYDAIVLSQHSAAARGVSLETATKKSFSSAAALTADIEEAVTSESISPRVRAKVDELDAGVTTAKQFLAECKRHGEGFTEVDLHFIKRMVKDGDTQKWVEAKLFDRSGDLGKKAASVTAKPSALARSLAANKKSAKKETYDLGDDDPESAEEQAELARGMAKAASVQNQGSKIPEMIAKMASGK